MKGRSFLSHFLVKLLTRFSPTSLFLAAHNAGGEHESLLPSIQLATSGMLLLAPELNVFAHLLYMHKHMLRICL